MNIKLAIKYVLVRILDGLKLLVKKLWEGILDFPMDALLAIVLLFAWFYNLFHKGFTFTELLIIFVLFIVGNIIRLKNLKDKGTTK